MGAIPSLLAFNMSEGSVREPSVPHRHRPKEQSDAARGVCRVFVLARNGTLLMPCKASRARILLKKGRAKVHKRYPFTIRLVNKTQGQTQPVALKLESPRSASRASASTSRTARSRNYRPSIPARHTGRIRSPRIPARKMGPSVRLLRCTKCSLVGIPLWVGPDASPGFFGLRAIQLAPI
jgi:hypothetical protein